MSNRSVSRGSWRHEPGDRGRSRGCLGVEPRGCLGVVLGHRGKPKLVYCPETAPRQPRDLPRCQNPTLTARDARLPEALPAHATTAVRHDRGTRPGRFDEKGGRTSSSPRTAAATFVFARASDLSRRRASSASRSTTRCFMLYLLAFISAADAPDNRGGNNPDASLFFSFSALYAAA